LSNANVFSIFDPLFNYPFSVHLIRKSFFKPSVSVGDIFNRIFKNVNKLRVDILVVTLLGLYATIYNINPNFFCTPASGFVVVASQNAHFIGFKPINATMG